MKIYTLNFEQRIPITLEEAWNFFSSPTNLSKITPSKMEFRITSEYSEDQKMYPGILVSYIITPLAGIKMNWLTEITHIKEKEYFIDEQRFGPYVLWHHQHHFEEITGGVYMKDILTYAIPYGFIGRIANNLIVENKIEEIFKFRKSAIEKLFGIYKLH